MIWAIVVLVWVVPYVIVKHLGVGIIRRGRGPHIGLTFDDGPDPEATPRVLDILRRHGARATFFVVGEAADAHPELVRQIVAAGHEVGSHSYRHRHALFHRPPLTGFFDTLKGISRLERVTGRRPTWFRPPWGAYSWSVLLAIFSARARPVNWSIESHDWHPRYAPPDVVRKVLAEARAGGIIVMHDAGRGAKKTVHALDGVLAGLSARGLSAVPLSEVVP